jgi:hypothetical protein
MLPRLPASLPDARSEAIPERIRRLGFRRWYERELIVGHGWLVACFLAMIVAVAGLELLSYREGFVELVADLSVVAGGTWLGWLGWSRYRLAMGRAGSIGDQAVCGGCGHFGFRAGEAHGERLSASCPRCRRQWWISAGRHADRS